MVAVISSGNLGVFTSNGSARGTPGATGSGQSPDQAYVNTTTGNLVIQQRDESLAAVGLDLSLIRTYNSQGVLGGDNNDNWRLGVYENVYGLSGTLNAAGNTVRKVFGDGADVLYSYNASLGKYVSADGDGASDTLSYSTSTSQWTWTDGSGRNTETYNSSGQLLNSKDVDGNTTSYSYTGSLLTSITDASGQITTLAYSGNNLMQISVSSSGQTQTRTRYAYDASNRLTQVTVDLSPSDNSIADGKTYVTSYTYDGTSKRVASITQGDGTTCSFIYQLIDGQYRVTSYTDGLGHVTRGNGAGSRVRGFLYKHRG
jgi:YD repeat-containing protein